MGTSRAPKGRGALRRLCPTSANTLMRWLVALLAIVMVALPGASSVCNDAAAMVRTPRV